MRQIGKVTRQGLTVILTVMSLAACNVGEPRAGKAKFFFKRDRDKTWGGVFEGQPSRSDSPKQFFIVEVKEVQFEPPRYYPEWKVSIRAIDLISDRSEEIDTWKFEPSSHADCIEHFDGESNTGMTTINGLSHRDYVKGDRNHERYRRLVVRIRGGRKPHYVKYTALGPDGTPVKYTSKAIIAYDKWKSLLEDGDDCDHVSQSGEEEGSVAP